MRSQALRAAVKKPEDFNDIRAKGRAKVLALSEKEGLRGSKRGTNLSDKSIARLLMLRDDFKDDETVVTDIDLVFQQMEVDETTIINVREQMKDANFTKHLELDRELKVTQAFPGEIKPRGFNFAPGTEVPQEDLRYWPTRFIEEPDEDNYEDGDLLYNVHEDKSFTVLNLEQQTKQWQSQNHLPPMNLIRRLGSSKSLKKTTEQPKEVKEVMKK